MLHLSMPRTFSFSFIAMIGTHYSERKGVILITQILLFPPSLLLLIRNLHLPSFCILPQSRQRFMVPIHSSSYSNTSRRDLECSNEGTESC